MYNCDSNYNVIIIGGGSAGCLLAGRLSENLDMKILLIEAGPNHNHPLISVPIGVGRLWKKRLYDWGLNSLPCDGLEGRSIELMRGKILGGSSAINAFTHVRGAPGDYDCWAKGGRPGWDYASLEPFFRSTESWSGNSHFRRGTDGPLSVSPAETKDPLFEGWLDAARKLGFPILNDFNALGPHERLHGFSQVQQSIGRGSRATAKTAFLRNAFSRSNLTIKTNTRALQLLFEKKGRSQIVAKGVRILNQSNDTVTNVWATDRVIVSAGAFHTPQLLMLSGIGPEADLKAAGVPLVLSAPGVGQNYQDHIAVQIRFKRKKPGPFHKHMRFDKLAINFPRAWFFGTGPSTVLPNGIAGFIHSSSRSCTPTFQFIFRGAPNDAGPWMPIISSGYEDGFGIRPVLLHPKSRGKIELANNDPMSPPLINGHFLEQPEDIEKLLEAVKIARDLSAQPPIQKYIDHAIDRLDSCNKKTTDWIRKTATTVHHPCGTCAMGPLTEHPVDINLNLKGCDKLNVVDASVMPSLVSGNINACVYMIAQKFIDQTERNKEL